MLHLLSCTYLETPLSYFRTEYLQKKQKRRRAESHLPGAFAVLSLRLCYHRVAVQSRGWEHILFIFVENAVQSAENDAEKLGGVHNGKRAKPLRLRFARHLPWEGRLSRGQSPRKKAPHAVGSWPSLRGLRGFGTFPQPPHHPTSIQFPKFIHFFVKKSTKKNHFVL